MPLRLAEPDGLVVHRPALLAERGIPCLVTTRLGPAGGELDAGALDEELSARLARLAGRPGARLARLHQVHGAHVVEVRASDELADPPPEADALVTGVPDVLLAVRSADCVPVLVASADGRRVAAVHAGWRGLLAGAIGAALARLGARPALAWVGPCLSRARFEVGPEVAERFLDAGHAAHVHDGPRGRPHVDLRAVARDQLEAAGARSIELDPRCTWEDPELWSYRRDVTHGSRPRTATFAALIGVAPQRGARTANHQVQAINRTWNGPRTSR